MPNLTYKDFEWPHNPHTYREEVSREPKFVTTEGVVRFQGLGEQKTVISGSGVFFGAEAYEKFRQLQALLGSAEPGVLTHPIWGSRNCYFTGLDMLQEPRENYVSYSFTFLGALKDGTVPA